jgi:imidazoleglycerol-phosphate dehydratase/histidinol-phosphatase
MKRVLFIDRDGTLISEPDDFQVDSFEKLKLLPGVVNHLGRIVAETDFELVMVSNQDGLGTDSLPERSFFAVHDFLLDLLANEGINFTEVCIDRSFEHENKPTRKPGTGMLAGYNNGKYDLSNSFVIGDRLTDVQLAANLGAKAILLAEPASPPLKYENPIALVARSWKEIYEFLRRPPRMNAIRRTTKETDVSVEINLDGKGYADISTGIPFFDHMLDQLARHASLDLKIDAKGDLQIDEHHTIEDVAITLGQAFASALGEKRGIERYGFTLPMDDCLAQVAVDLGGRNWLVWDVEFSREMIGAMSTEMFLHFFKSFSDHAKCNLNIKAEGSNEHHKIEAIFKALARALKIAVKRDALDSELPSTKGRL